MPTAFGEVSFTIVSKLNDGTVTADLALPTRSNPEKTLFRLRLPDGWKIDSADASGQVLNLDGETIDISALRGKTTVTAKVSKK